MMRHGWACVGLVLLTLTASLDAQSHALSIGRRGRVAETPNPPLAVTTASLPGCTVGGAAYTRTLESTGGVGLTRTWAVQSGTLPAGLSLAAATGAITGNCTTAGVSTLVFRVTDQGALTADSGSLSLVVSASSGPAPLQVMGNSTIPNATLSVAYSNTFQCSGGTPPCTWAVSVGSPLTGLTLNASTGALSGTCSVAAQQVTFTVRATDAAAVTATLQIVNHRCTDPTAEGPHDYFNGLLANAACYKAYSFRPAAGIAKGSGGSSVNCAFAHYEHQLRSGNGGGYKMSNNADVPDFVTYTSPREYADTSIPGFDTVGRSQTLTVAVDASATVITLTSTTNQHNSIIKSAKLGNEVVLLNGCAISFVNGSCTGQQVNVTRGADGTTAVAHAIGTAVQLNVNSPITGGGLKMPLVGENGFTYLVIQDTLLGSGYNQLRTSGTQDTIKWYNWITGRIWFEPRIQWAGTTLSNPADWGSNSAYIGSLDFRNYTQRDCAVTIWEPQYAGCAGPNVTGANGGPLEPMANTMGLYANVWVRTFILLKIVEDDWDIISYWVADETRGPVQIIDARQTSTNWNPDVPAPTLAAAITRSGATATATTLANHKLETGMTVTMSGATEPEYNGTFVITKSTSKIFTYAVAGTPATPATGSPQVSQTVAQWELTTAEVGLQEWFVEYDTSSNGYRGNYSLDGRIRNMVTLRWTNASVPDITPFLQRPRP
ncbi:MAG: putative Ig domain-containing protein [Gemmatimonadaceae bacterium]|nr:putative Ig domain-containing protein [Gemmatimonadaceae bacterium]